MYTFVRRADAQKLEAMTFAVEIAQVVKKVSGIDVMLGAQVFGYMNRVFWVVAGIESVDDFAAKMEALNADPAYLAKVAESIAGEYFRPGSFEDALIRTVPV